ncbi:MAG: response regulator [Chitinivibrionales bacterium]|nr:response regulator [Chitinivibrionales bacterium]
MLPRKILIIDDEKMIRLTTSILLKKHGIEVHTASSGEEGIGMAEKVLPELILLDIIMPEMNGWEVLGRLQRHPVLQSIPVIVFTADDFRLTEKNGQGKGIYKILIKPFQLDKLLDACELPEEKGVE